MSAYDRGDLSRREFQIMESIYEHGPCSAAEIRKRLPDAPGDSTVRKLLEILEAKGHLFHEKVGQRYVYHPKISAARARRSALGQVVQTFFGGSRERAAAALLGLKDGETSEETLKRIATLAEKARGEGR